MTSLGLPRDRKRFRNPGGNGIATIRELAEQIGVSMATVSRVLNNYPDVSPETRERVLAHIRKLDWTPDHAARTMVTGKTNVIGVILDTGSGHPDLQHPFFQEVLSGLKRSLGSLGYDLLLFSTEQAENAFADTAFARGETYVSRARHHRVDGVVLMGADPHAAQVEEVVRSGLPCMAVDLDLEGGRTGYVMSDNVAGAVLAVRHLHELGHRRIAMIAGPADTRPGVDRLLGYRRELNRLGIEHRAEYVREGDFYPESGYAETLALLDLPEPPSAVFAAADLMAAGALQAIGERGLSVPSDIAVVGFDDVQIAPLLRPPLTTIRQDKQALGAAAGEAVIRLIEDPDLVAPVITIPVELVVRESTLGTGRQAEAGSGIARATGGGRAAVRS
jgi:LacI family transcriptional regulator, galactose operon repressor